MNWKFRSLVIIAGISVAASASARQPEELEVLGIHLGDDKAKVLSILRAGGYSQIENVGLTGKCNSSYAAVKSGLLAQNKTKSELRSLDCTETFANSEKFTVTVDYMYAPRGPVVSGASFHFKSLESKVSVADRLTKKFGKPCRGGEFDTYWWNTGRACGAAEPYMKYDGGGSIGHRISMEGGAVMNDVFREQLDKDLLVSSRRAPQVKF